MYGYQKRESKLKRILVLLVLMMVVSATSIFVYDMYIRIDVSNYEPAQNPEVKRLAQTEEINQKTEDATGMLENATQCVVRDL